MRTFLRIIWPFIIIGLGAGAAYLVVSNHRPHDTTLKSAVPPQAKAAASAAKPAISTYEFDSLKKGWTDRSIAFQAESKEYKDADATANTVEIVAAFAKKYPGIQVQLFGWMDGSDTSVAMTTKRLTKLSDDLKTAGVSKVVTLGKGNYMGKNTTATTEQKKKLDTVDVTIAPLKQ